VGGKEKVDVEESEGKSEEERSGKNATYFMFVQAAVTYFKKKREGNSRKEENSPPPKNPGGVFFFQDKGVIHYIQST